MDAVASRHPPAPCRRRPRPPRTGGGPQSAKRIAHTVVDGCPRLGRDVREAPPQLRCRPDPSAAAAVPSPFQRRCQRETSPSHPPAPSGSQRGYTRKRSDSCRELSFLLALDKRRTSTLGLLFSLQQLAPDRVM